MADYAQISFRARYSEDENHADPEWATNWSDANVTVDEGHVATVEAGTSATTIIANTLYASIASLTIKNLDPTGGNKVTVTWTDNAANANTQVIPAGGILVAPDVDGSVAVVATAANSAVRLRVAALGT